MNKSEIETSPHLYLTNNCVFPVFENKNNSLTKLGWNWSFVFIWIHIYMVLRICCVRIKILTFYFIISFEQSRTICRVNFNRRAKICRQESHALGTCHLQWDRLTHSNKSCAGVHFHTCSASNFKIPDVEWLFPNQAVKIHIEQLNE